MNFPAKMTRRYFTEIDVLACQICLKLKYCLFWNNENHHFTFGTLWNVPFSSNLESRFSGKIQMWSKSLMRVWLLEKTLIFLLFFLDSSWLDFQRDLWLCFTLTSIDGTTSFSNVTDRTCCSSTDQSHSWMIPRSKMK